MRATPAGSRQRPQSRAWGQRSADPSEQQPHARHHTHRVAVLALYPGEVRGLAEFRLPVQADIGCDGAVDQLVTNPQPQLQVGEALSLADLPVVGRREVACGDGLQDQAVGDQQVVFRAEPGRKIALLAEEQVAIDLDPLRRQPLEAEQPVKPVWARSEERRAGQEYVRKGRYRESPYP